MYGGGREILDGLVRCQDALRVFGYDLWRKYQGHGARWTRHFGLSGSPYTIWRADGKEVYDGRIGPVVALHLSPTRQVGFEVSLCWTADAWMIEAEVSLDDDDPETGAVQLWEWPARRTSDVTEAVTLLTEATNALIAYGRSTDFTPYP